METNEQQPTTLTLSEAQKRAVQSLDGKLAAAKQQVHDAEEQLRGYLLGLVVEYQLEGAWSLRPDGAALVECPVAPKCEGTNETHL